MTRRAAERLVRLYPGGWRARYGDEFSHVLRDQRLTLRLALDVFGGAIDAHINGGTMTELLLKRCAAGGPRLTRQEVWRANGVMLGASLIFASLYIWAKMNFANKDMVDAFGIMGFPAAMIVAMPFSYLKDASRGAQITIVGGCLLILGLGSYMAAMI